MKCSIVVANYNHADVLTQALGSIEQQTYTNWEVVIVDDGSTDNSLAVINDYLANVQDPKKYKLVHLSDNIGLPRAKHLCVINSSGEVVAICDPDDMLHAEAVEKVMQAHMHSPNASVVFTNMYRCSPDMSICEICQEAGPVLFNNLLENKISAFASFKREAYDKTSGFDPNLTLGSDQDLYYKLEEVGDVVYINEPLYYYRIWPRGVSQGFDNYVRSRDFKLIAVKNAIQRRQLSGVKMPSKKEIRVLLSEIHLLQAEGLMYSQQDLGRKFIKHLGLSILYNPIGNLTRKIKTAFLLSRIKRNLMKASGEA
ncbi:glycosyltransferase family 2 protein [Pontibacter roseus]|uniref:glycosyltransferase family 2 protein n=1 Tax=Pontibacter roseus TaxID=336989 RepID=UPI00037ABF20|nr:glycosyltransferase family A protein [Pontibacter roseus]